jgi:hypothetical protein
MRLITCGFALKKYFFVYAGLSALLHRLPLAFIFFGEQNLWRTTRFSIFSIFQKHVPIAAGRKSIEMGGALSPSQPEKIKASLPSPPPEKQFLPKIKFSKNPHLNFR